MKGMAYTPFAILATSMLFLMFIAPLDVYPEPVQQDIQVIETAHTYDSSVKNSFKQGFGNTVNNHFVNFNEGIIQSSSPENDAQENFEDEYNKEDFSDFKDNLESLVDSDRRNLESTTGNNLEFNHSGLTINSEIDFSYELTDQNTDTEYRFDNKLSSQAVIDGAQDPFNYFRADEEIFYNYCGYEKPAKYEGSGTDSSGTITYGEAIINPEEPENVENQGEKIAFTDQVDSAGEYSNFKGLVVEVEEDVSAENNVWVSNFGGTVREGENVIIDNEDIYTSYFREIIFEDCFVETSDGPNIFDRMENSSQASESGIATFTDSPEDPESANEDYYYHSSRTGTPVEVKGVTIDEEDEGLDWFKVHEGNMAQWNLSSLIYE